MIQTKDRLLSAAKLLIDPRIIVDTSKGSLQARFMLIDHAPTMPIDSYPEISRALFNGLRDQGILAEPASGPVKVGGYRAFYVKSGEQEDGSQQEV